MIKFSIFTKLLNNKMKKKKGKAITLIESKYHTKFPAKNYFILSRFTYKYVDTNNCGDLFFSSEDRKNLLEKWELILEDSPNFVIRNAVSGFYLGTDMLGGLYCGLLSTSPFQRWKFYATTEPEIFGVLNSGSGLYLDVIEKSEHLMTWKIDNKSDMKSTQLFRIYPYNIEKR